MKSDTMNDPLPDELIEKFTPSQLTDANAWWTALSANSKTEIIILLDSRMDGQAYVYSVDEDGHRKWQSVPIENDPIPEHDHDDEEFWVEELIHYRLDHEEFVMASDMKECTIRTFGVCSQHDSAKKVISDRKLSKSFSCSNNDGNCPIKEFTKSFNNGVMLDHDPNTGRSVWLTR